MMDKKSGHLIPKLYYAITPAFIMLDYFCGINIRVAVLDNMPLYKGLYYGFCIICGVVIFLIPRSSSIVALIESIIIIMLTVLGVLLPYSQILSQANDILNADFEKINVFNPQYIANLVLAGSIAYITFRKSLRELGSSNLR
jgi:hypothetical protein